MVLFLPRQPLPLNLEPLGHLRFASSMGYDLHITRAAEWSDPAGPHISAEEWWALVADDPELSPDPAFGLHLARWSGHSAHKEPWLAWSEPGSIFTKYPDQALVAKMLQIAERLGARVQGDDGEFYTDPSQVPADSYFTDSPTVELRRPWWRRFSS